MGRRHEDDYGGDKCQRELRNELTVKMDGTKTDARGLKRVGHGGERKIAGGQQDVPVTHANHRN